MLEKLREKNPDLKIQPLDSPEFRVYGMVHPEVNAPKMKEFVKAHKPECEELYIPCEKELMEMEESRVFKENLFGQMDCQIGYYYGRGTKLNAVEYHKCSEVLVLFEAAVLALGSVWDIEEGRLDSSRMKLFYVPADTCVELYATTLHFSPLMATQNGVSQVVVQASGTNTPLLVDRKDRITTDKYLLERNKWVLAHAEYMNELGENAYEGIVGDNITLSPLE